MDTNDQALASQPCSIFGWSCQGRLGAWCQCGSESFMKSWKLQVLDKLHSSNPKVCSSQKGEPSSTMNPWEPCTPEGSWLSL
jgi:hypothetical protein